MTKSIKRLARVLLLWPVAAVVGAVLGMAFLVMDDEDKTVLKDRYGD